MKQVLQIGVAADIIPADSPLMSGQGVYSACQGDFSKLFSAFQRYSEKFDFLIGNFEAVLVDNIEKVSPGDSAMKAPASILPVLVECKFKYLSIANNHTMEYGPEAFRWMCDTFMKFDILTFGYRDCPFCFVDDPQSNLKVGLFAFSTVPAMYGYVPEYYFVNIDSEEEISFLLNRLTEAKKDCDYLLVFPHWGSEFMPRPAPWQIKLARKMVECGVDAILGAHPHVIQTACYIKNTPVLFSMGNFLSDYFQEVFKRNAFIELEISENCFQIGSHIFSYDKDFIIYDSEEELALDDVIEDDESPEEYVEEANEIRKVVRRQLIWHLLKKPHRWLLNKGMWRWLLSRALFLALNAKKIKSNPNAIYSGPIH